MPDGVGALVQLAHQPRGPRRRCHLPTKNATRADRMSVEARVRLFLRGDDRTFQRNAGEQTFAPAVSIDRGFGRDCRLKIASHGAGSGAHIRAECDIAVARERTNSAGVIENENEIGHLRADLKTKARTAGADEGRSRPAVASARYNHALSALAAKAEADFEDADDRKPTRVPHDVGWNRGFRNVPEVPQNFGRLGDDFLFGRGRSERYR